MRAPSFRQVCQYTGHVAATIADQALIAFGGHLDQRGGFSEREAGDFLLGRMESEGPDAADVEPSVCYFCDRPTDRQVVCNADFDTEYVCEKCAELATAPAATPRAADDPAGGTPPTPAGSLTFDELPTSALLNRAATTLLIAAACVAVAVSDAAVPADDLDRFTNELRDRAAQFAAHGD